MRRHLPPSEEVLEDAWGDEGSGVEIGIGTQLGQLKKGYSQAQQAAAAGQDAQASTTAAPAAAQLSGGTSEARGPPSLYSFCLGVLAEHLEDLLADPVCRLRVLPVLPSDVKACLLAVARLRRMLSDTALLLLADSGQPVLDLHGCGDLVTDAGIRAALPRMSHLRHVDLTSCRVGAATLRTLGASCPGVEVLRLGSPATDAAAARGLSDILPSLEQRQLAPAADSWHTLLEVTDAHELTAAVAGRGRLTHLRCLAWPNIPFPLEQHCRKACPTVALNPTAEEAAGLHLPAACYPEAQLDAPFLAEVAGSERWAGAPDVGALREVVLLGSAGTSGCRPSQNATGSSSGGGSYGREIRRTI